MNGLSLGNNSALFAYAIILAPILISIVCLGLGLSIAADRQFKLLGFLAVVLMNLTTTMLAVVLTLTMSAGILTSPIVLLPPLSVVVAACLPKR